MQIKYSSDPIESFTVLVYIKAVFQIFSIV